MTKLHNLLKQVVNSKETNLNENKRHGVTIWLSIVCLLFFISMVACAPTTSSDGGGSKTFIYPSATFGISTNISPTAPPSQATSYALTNDAVGTITPPTIDATTGDITTTVTTTAGVYSVTVYDNSGTQITTSSFTVTYIATNKVALEREIKGSTATGRAAWGDASNFNYIDTSRVTDMSSLFSSDNTFNGDISNWDVSSVVNMNTMFILASAFNQNIGGWDVSSVTTMGSMFFNTSTFNQDLSSWDVSSVTDMSNMFFLATAFNQNLDSWNVQSSVTVTDMFVQSGQNPLPTWCNTRGC